MRIALGTDEHTTVSEHVIGALRGRGHEVVVVAEGKEWADVGREVGEAVARGEAERGVLFCWTGTGVSIAANKVPGVRAALCTDRETAEGARQWNDANVLVMSLRLTSPPIAEELLDAFLTTEPLPSEAEAIARLDDGPAQG